MPNRLAGQVILNTRPAHQQAELARLLEPAGARVLSFPAIEIVAVKPTRFHRQLAQTIDQYDILLFISRNAVDGAFRFIGDTPLPAAMRLGVIGEATRIALAQQVENLSSRLVSGDPFNSEALLSAAALQAVEGKRVLIFRGQAGRNLLGDELEQRGASVGYCEVYRRELPRPAANAFGRLVEDAFPTLVVLTSNQGMHNLMQLVDAPAAQRLSAVPWLLISERMRESALKLGHNAPIIIAHSASDNGIHQTICEWADQQ